MRHLCGNYILSWTKEIGSQPEEMKETKEHYIRWYSYAPSEYLWCSSDESSISQSSQQGPKRLQTEKEASSIAQKKLSWSKTEKREVTTIAGWKYSEVTAGKLFMIFNLTGAKFSDH